MRRRLLWLLPALLPAGLLAFGTPAPPDAPALRAFGRIPVLQGGRVKPLDTIARSSLLMIRGKQTLELEGRRLGASEWLLETMASPERANNYPGEPSLRSPSRNSPPFSNG